MSFISPHGSKICLFCQLIRIYGGTYFILVEGKNIFFSDIEEKLNNGGITSSESIKKSNIVEKYCK